MLRPRSDEETTTAVSPRSLTTAVAVSEKIAALCEKITNKVSGAGTQGRVSGARRHNNYAKISPSRSPTDTTVSRCSEKRQHGRADHLPRATERAVETTSALSCVDAVSAFLGSRLPQSSFPGLITGLAVPTVRFFLDVPNGAYRPTYRTKFDRNYRSTTARNYRPSVCHVKRDVKFGR